LNCSWCDTKYSNDETQAYEALPAEIVGQIRLHGTTHLCITGGEPLLSERELFDLLDLILKENIIEDVAIETNGSLNVAEVCQYRKDKSQKISIIIDYKLNSSQMTAQMDEDNFSLLSETDELKFVVASKLDFLQAQEILKKYYKKGIVLFSPVINLFSPAQLAEEILSCNDFSCKLSLQIHKYIWPSEIRSK
jgi:7-carboxy-7-deazaguanine synthase